MTAHQPPADISSFTRKVEFSLQSERYRVYTISTASELEEVLRLRYDVFYREIAHTGGEESGIDIDEFDLCCDHLAAVDRKTGKIVATYRLNSNLYSTRFYAETEFEMESILSAPGIKLETGRACVHPDFRRGSLIILLWRAIIEYMKKIDARFLFGCSSVTTTDLPTIREINRLFKHTYYTADTYRVSPLPALAVPNLDMVTGEVPADPFKRLAELIPPLFMGYLANMSCNVCGDPALDEFFNCSDFLILLDRENLKDITRKRYGL